jgi:hypothetical protein
MMPKLIPAGVQIGAAAAFAGNVMRQVVFDEALLGQPSLGRRHSAGKWLVSLAIHAPALISNGGAAESVHLGDLSVLANHRIDSTSP